MYRTLSIFVAAAMATTDVSLGVSQAQAGPIAMPSPAAISQADPGPAPTEIQYRRGGARMSGGGGYRRWYRSGGGRSFAYGGGYRGYRGYGYRRAGYGYRGYGRYGYRGYGRYGYRGYGYRRYGYGYGYRRYGYPYYGYRRYGYPYYRRYGYYGYPYYSGYYDNYYPGLALGLFGLAAGALASSAYAYPAYGDAGWVEACARKYRSFDPASGTYLGYDGLRHRCVLP